MPFRIEEEKAKGWKLAVDYLTNIPQNGLTDREKEFARSYLSFLAKKLGPVVHSYPVWHPLVCSMRAKTRESTYPDVEAGYQGLDHVVCFAHGFIVCPYSDGSDILESVNNLTKSKMAKITAKILDFPLYAKGACPVLVSCDWAVAMNPDHTIPTRVAVTLMLKQKLNTWKKSPSISSWERECYSLLGSPHGQLSSLFINRETGLKMRKVWQAAYAAQVF